MTVRLYLEDPYREEFDAQVQESEGGRCVLSATAFYPGGGGQPADRGRLILSGRTIAVPTVREDDAGRIWHQVGEDPQTGTPVRGAIDWSFRYALMRHHALMHVVNTVARRLFGGAITGVQLGSPRSRIDLALAGFTREWIGELERHVNETITRALAISSSTVAEDEYRNRPDLVRTLNVRPPIDNGRVRVVTIDGFDVQACGGTHVHSTAEIGEARVVKVDNKGRENRRFYWEIAG